jgi:hypothetical protein
VLEPPVLDVSGVLEGVSLGTPKAGLSEVFPEPPVLVAAGAVCGLPDWDAGAFGDGALEGDVDAGAPEAGALELGGVEVC